MYNNQKLLTMHIFPKFASISKRRTLKMTSTTDLFRKVKQLAVYQLLPNLTIREDFG